MPQINRVNKSEAVKLRIENGLTYQEIAKLQGVSAPAVFNSIKDLLPDDDTREYINSRAEIFAKAQCLIAKTLNGSCIQMAGLGERTNALVKLHAAERLERGQTTANLGTGIVLSAPLQESLDRLINRLSPVDSLTPFPVDNPVTNNNKDIHA